MSFPLDAFAGMSITPAKRTNPDDRKSAELLRKLKKEIEELLAQYNGDDDLTFKPDFRKKYNTDFLQLFQRAKTGTDYYNVITMFESGISDDFKCRRWVGDVENARDCSCYRCSLTRDQWLKEMKRGKRHMTEASYAKHLLEKLAEFDHYSTDGFRTLDEKGNPVQYLEGLNEDKSEDEGGRSGDKSEVEKLAKEVDVLRKEKEVLARENEALSRELSKSKSSFRDLQSSISLVFEKSKKES